jgi:Coenzyme F420-dependent N5,N10-methylene tetrahydromethanopterin reductase and related flavin-dependent oxidoreductases
MKFGIGYYSLQSPPHNPHPHQKLYAEMLDEIRAAEELGFESAWLTEHHFLDDGYCPSLLLTAAAIAASTKKVRIGTGILLMPLHDPIRVAEDAAVADLISGGRLILGLGLGYRKEEFDGFDVSLKSRKGRMEESIEILQKSWADEPFSLQGKYYQYENINVTPKPVQKPIPIWIGAFTEPAIRRAARIGAPLYVPAVGIIPIVKYLFDLHSSLLREYGRNPNDFEKPLVREIYVSNERGDVVWEKIKEHGTYTAKGYASWGSMVDRSGNLLSDPNDPILYELAKEQGIFGTPEECIETIHEYKKRYR